MRKIRVLVVDDAVVVRRLVTEALAGDPAIEVVGVAANGRIALAKVAQVTPDLVTLDVEMPEMDGLQTLAELRKTHPRLPVIMFSTLTQRGASATMDALALGAKDYVAKPSNVGSVAEGLQRIREELIPKVKALVGASGRGGAEGERVCPLIIANEREGERKLRLSHSRQFAQISGRLPSPPLPRVDVVAIGVSTGGPNALAQLLPRLPATFPVPIVIVQHMPPIFTRLLSERLSANSELTVTEGATGDRPRPGHVFIAPGDFHMVLERAADRVAVRLQQGPPENSCRPAADVLFRSVVQVYGGHVLAVVLTGMGQDGLRGCERVREAGGRVIVQDEASSVVWGMPGFVARAGLADKVLPLDQIAAEIVRQVWEGQGGAWRLALGAWPDPAADREPEGPSVRREAPVPSQAPSAKRQAPGA